MTRIGMTLPVEAGAPRNVVVQRLFPTFDFALRTSVSPTEASRTLEAALEAPVRSTWLPMARLTGRVNGSVFQCWPWVTPLGGSMAPSVSGAILPRNDGGADVLVRVFDWPSLLILGIALVACLASMISDQGKLALTILATFSLVGLGSYAANAVFVRRIFKRIFQTGIGVRF